MFINKIETRIITLDHQVFFAVRSYGLKSFSKGKHSNLRRSSVQMTLKAISELVTPHVLNDSSERTMEKPSHRKQTTAPADTKPVKRSTRNKCGAKAKEVEEVSESIPDVNEANEVQDQILVSEAVVKIPSSERLSADSLLKAGVSLGRSANKIPIAASGSQTKLQGSSRKSARRSLVVRRSLVGLRHSVTQKAVRRASRHSFLKKKARLRNSTCGSSISDDICMDVETEEVENKEEQVDAPQIVTEPATTENHRVTRSMARTSERDVSGGSKSKEDGRLTHSGSKRLTAQEINTTKKKQSPPKKCLTERDRQKRDTLNKKTEQKNEQKKKTEEKRQNKLEEMKRKREERLKRVVEVQVKGEKEQEKKKIEEKRAQLEKKSDMRLAEEKAKRKVATKRQKELELRKKQKEAARQKKLQQGEEEERRHQELLAKRKADEEREKVHKLTKAARALELKKEQERKRERERERQAAAEKERLEKEKAIALQKELERAAKEKERREMGDKRKMNSVFDSPVGEGAGLNKTIDHGPGLNVTVDIENSVFDSPVGEGAAYNKTIDHGPGLNVTVDIEQSPQSYQITPEGQKVNPEDFGMDQNSDDSIDDESAPVKPIPSWAEGMQVKQAITEQYHNPLDLDSYFGEPEPPKLEEIFSPTS